MMKPRLNPYQAAPELMKALAAFGSQVESSGLERAATMKSVPLAAVFVADDGAQLTMPGR
jgi:hypothetical protein